MTGWSLNNMDRTLLVALALALVLGSPVSTAAAPAEPVAGPAAAPVAPDISIARAAGTNNAQLSWEHETENEGYQVWRGVAPYFNPPGEGGQIAYRSAASCGQPCYFDVTDDGVDRYPNDGTLPTVQVIGVSAVNYYWVVRGQNGDGVSDNSNRAGEFDYDLVAGS